MLEPVVRLHYLTYTLTVKKYLYNHQLEPLANYTQRDAHTHTDLRKHRLASLSSVTGQNIPQSQT